MKHLQLTSDMGIIELLDMFIIQLGKSRKKQAAFESGVPMFNYDLHHFTSEFSDGRYDSMASPWCEEYNTVLYEGPHVPRVRY